MGAAKGLDQEIVFYKALAGQVKSQVIHIMAEYPETRNNDGILLVRWLEVFKGIDSHQGLLRLAMAEQFNFESVRRERQKIQRAGLFLPTDPEVVEKRKLLDIIHRVIQRGDQHNEQAEKSGAEDPES